MAEQMEELRKALEDDDADLYEVANKHGIPYDKDADMDAVASLIEMEIQKREGSHDWEKIRNLFKQNQEYLEVSKENLKHNLSQFKEIIEAFHHIQPTGRQEKLKDRNILALPKDIVTVIDSKVRYITKKKEILVCGQESSGKSSLLNAVLDLKEEPLQVGRDSCTKKVWKIHEISQEEMETTPPSSIKKEENLDGDIVTKKLQDSIIKNGPVLIDTPGFMRNDMMMKYAEENDICGFIFTINPIAGGGFTEQFQEVLYHLTTLGDSQNTMKLDSESALFVCNMWDEVPQCDKEAQKVEQLAKSVLRNVAALKDIDFDEQFYKMDSKDAYANRMKGYIAEDLKKLLSGFPIFFLTCQSRCLKTVYVWFMKCMDNALYSLRFLQWWMDCGTNSNVAKKTIKDDIECIYESQKAGISIIRKNLDFDINRIVENLSTFLEQSSSPFDIDEDSLSTPVDTDNIHLKELDIDKAIDKKISKLLLNWERENGLITAAKETQHASINETKLSFDKQWEDFINKFKGVGNFGVVMRSKTEDKNKGYTSSNDEERVSLQRFTFGQTYGTRIFWGCSVNQRKSLAKMKGSYMISEWAGPVKNNFLKRLFLKIKQNRDVKDVSSNISFRASYIFEKLREKAALTLLVRSQFQETYNLITAIEKDALNYYEHKCLLIDEVATIVNSIGKSHWKLLNKTLSLVKLQGTTLISAFQFGLNPFECGFTTEKFYNTAIKTENTFEGLAGFFETKSEDGSNVGHTIRYPGKYMCKEEMLHQLPAHRIVQFETEICPRVLGHCDGPEHDIGLVYESKYITAEKYFQKIGSSLAVIGEKGRFIETIIQIFHHLHRKKLVCLGLCLNSILIEEYNEAPEIWPLFCNLRPSGEVFINCSPENSLESFIFLAPEVLQTKVYDIEADIYSLGMMMVQLFLGKGIFSKWKAVSVGHWCNKLGTYRDELRTTCMEYDENPVVKRFLEVAFRCITQSPGTRLTISEIMQQFEPDFCEHHFD